MRGSEDSLFGMTLIPDRSSERPRVREAHLGPSLAPGHPVRRPEPQSSLGGKAVPRVNSFLPSRVLAESPAGHLLGRVSGSAQGDSGALCSDRYNKLETELSLILVYFSKK